MSDQLLEFQPSRTHRPFGLSQGIDLLASGWRPHLHAVFEAEFMRSLDAFLQGECHSQQIVYPPQEHIFRALRLVDPDEVRVVVFGQDPYHGPGQANGLAFAVNAGQRIPPSLAHIFRELAADLEVPCPVDPSLLGWAEQGVLLLNSVLTVRSGEAFSHRGKGWEDFTNAVVQVVNTICPPSVFVLWGAAAQKAAAYVNLSKHFVISSPHPSPLSAHRGFFGSRPFSKANRFLTAHGREPVDWSQTGPRASGVLHSLGSGVSPAPA